MKNLFWIVSFSLALVAFQDNLDKRVMRKHPNGQPYVIMYFIPNTTEYVKEEVYFPNGKLQWQGTYKKTLEEGEWTYYYESGVVKSVQHYSKGKEHGQCIDYDAKGKLIKETNWVNGKEVKTVKH